MSGFVTCTPILVLRVNCQLWLGLNALQFWVEWKKLDFQIWIFWFEISRFQTGIIGSVWVPQGAEPEAETDVVTLYQGVQFQEQEWEARREKQGRTQNRRHIINLGISKCSGLLSPLWRNPSGQALEPSGAWLQGRRRSFCLYYSEVLYPVFALMTPHFWLSMCQCRCWAELYSRAPWSGVRCTLGGWSTPTVNWNERQVRLTGSPGGSVGKESACEAGDCLQETWVQSMDQEDPLQKEMVTHSSILAWEIPWTQEPGGPQSMGSWESDNLTTKPPPPCLIGSEVIRKRGLVYPLPSPGINFVE